MAKYVCSPILVVYRRARLIHVQPKILVRISSCHLRCPQCLTTHIRGRQVLCTMTKGKPMYELTEGFAFFLRSSLDMSMPT
jgi:hypothetical protein